MTRCQIIRAECSCKVEQLAELYRTVALHARIGRSPAQIFRDKIIFDLGFENRSEIRDVMIYAKVPADFLSVGNIFVAVKPHCHADNVKSLLKQKCRSQRTVNTSAHRHGNFVSHIEPPKKFSCIRTRRTI